MNDRTTTHAVHPAPVIASPQTLDDGSSPGLAMMAGFTDSSRASCKKEIDTRNFKKSRLDFYNPSVIVKREGVEIMPAAITDLLKDPILKAYFRSFWWTTVSLTIVETAHYVLFPQNRLLAFLDYYFLWFPIWLSWLALRLSIRRIPQEKLGRIRNSLLLLLNIILGQGIIFFQKNYLADDVSDTMKLWAAVGKSLVVGCMAIPYMSLFMCLFGLRFRSKLYQRGQVDEATSSDQIAESIKAEDSAAGELQ
jgi:hypothetical protein